MGRKPSQNHQLYTTFRFNDEIMEALGIPKIDLINGEEELWRYAIFDRDKALTKAMKYFVSTYGRVYSIKRKKILTNTKSSFFKSNVSPYLLVSVTNLNNKNRHYLVHRLVALAFIPNVENKPFINHKDGNPLHCYVWNLEWSTPSENYTHALKTGLKNEPRGENRVNAKWTDNEIHIVCKMIEEGHKATYIYQVLGDLLNDPKVQYERVRSLYKHIKHQTHWTHISKLYNIDFSRYDYSKEALSVAKVKANK